MKHSRNRVAFAGVSALIALSLMACSQNGDGTQNGDGGAPAVDTTAPVTISVGGLPTTENAKQRQQMLRVIKDFEAKNQNITIEPEETIWELETFQAHLAGGTLPTVIGVPFTEIRSLIERRQVADITDYVADSDVLSSLNPSVQKVATNADGNVFGVPTTAYTMGLLYNRALFTEAGLDPDAPPRTWEEVRTAASAIATKTDAAGFQTMTLEATGGWALTTTSYGLGAEVEQLDGETVTANVNNPATTQALEFYRHMRWEDDSMGANFLLNYDDANKAFASGQVGMFIQGADNYPRMVTNLGMAPADFGVAPLPQGPNGIGTLGGGGIAIVNPKASPEEITAAVKWIEFSDFRRYTDEELAVTEAKAAIADGVDVGAPELPVVGQEDYDRWLGWIDGQINVPRENYELYFSTVQSLPLVPEPPVKAQEVYATLDPVVQAVLTRQDADIPQLLSKAQKTVQSAIDAG